MKQELFVLFCLLLLGGAYYVVRMFRQAVKDSSIILNWNWNTHYISTAVKQNQGSYGT